MNNTSTEGVTLSTQQQAVYNRLNDELQLPVYADAYKGALDMLRKRSHGYVTFVSHTGRDFMNTLATTVKKMESSQLDDGSVPKQTRFEYKDFVDDVAKIWKDKWGRDRVDVDEFRPEHGQAPDQRDDTENEQSIPTKVCKKVQILIDEHRAGQERDAEKGSLFFTSFLDYSDKDDIPKNLSAEWNQTKKWFVAHAHLRIGEFDAKHSADVEKHFRTLEDLLFAAASTEIERLGAIDEILEEANE